MARRRGPPIRELGFLANCLWTVATIRLALTLRRFDAVRKRIRSLPTSDEPTVHDMRHIAWGVTATSRFVPGATCLTQALAGQLLLARRGKKSIVRVSVEQSEGFRPHAWLIAGETLVLGGTSADYARYATLVDYGP